MRLFDKIILCLAESGRISLKDLGEKYNEDEEFVEACMNSRGVQEFQYASEWLKSDADFILKWVSKKPEILEYCADIVYDRYLDNLTVYQEKEIKTFWFALMCCRAHTGAYKYIDDESAKMYYDAVKGGKTYKGEYHGETEIIKLENDRDYLDTLLYVRYGIVKSGLNLL